MWTKTTRVIALCSAANFINSADRVLMPIAIIPMTARYKWTLYWQGWILSSFAFGFITSQVIGASAATRFGGKRVLTFAVLLWSSTTLLTPLVAHRLPWLIFCRILLGLGEGLGLPTIFNIFAQSVPVNHRSRAFSYLVGAGTIGQCVASLICPHLQWQWMFFAFGALGVAWVAIWLVLYSDFKDETPRDDSLPLINGSAGGATTPRAVHWSRFVTRWPLWAIYIAHFSMNWTNYIVMQWLPTYLVTTLGANRESISLTALPYIVNSAAGIGSFLI